jgi:hypothetical protein
MHEVTSSEQTVYELSQKIVFDDYCDWLNMSQELSSNLRIGIMKARNMIPPAIQAIRYPN